MTDRTKAFPNPQDRRVEGMDLRDWLAGQYLAGIAPYLGAKLDAAGPLAAPEIYKRCSREAYMVADEFMERRTK